MLKFINKLQRQDIKSFTVKPGVIDEFIAVRDVIFQTTVFTQPCKSWCVQLQMLCTFSLTAGINKGDLMDPFLERGVDQACIILSY